MRKPFLLAPIVLLLGAQGYLRPEEPSRIFAAGAKEAYYMEPPESASKAYARRLLWTADGSHLIVERVVPAPGATPFEVGLGRETPNYDGVLAVSDRVQLVSWSRRSHTGETLLDLSAAKARIVAIEAMAGSDRVVVTLSETYVTNEGASAWRTAYVLVTGGIGSYRRLWTQTDSRERVSFALSPMRPLGQLVRQVPGETTTVSYFGADGELGRRLPVPSGGSPFFAADGLPGMSVRGTNPAGKPTFGSYRFDPQTGGLGGPLAEAAIDTDVVNPPLHVTNSKRSAEVRLSVAGGKPDEVGLVTSDGAMPVLSPKNDAVAYLSAGGAYVRTLVRLGRKAYEASLIDAARQKALRQAKEAGTALSMYAMDADDAFPPGGNIPDVVGPYARDVASLQALVYTFGGGVPGSKDGTEIGYVPGPGGRAVVYADGTVKWIPDAP